MVCKADVFPNGKSGLIYHFIMCQNVGKQGQVTEDLLCEISVGKYSNTGCEQPFDFRTGFILRGIDSTRCWRHSFRDFSQY